MNSFGSFLPLFDERMLYLKLLHLRDGAPDALQAVDEAIRSSPDARREIINLLLGENGWRPQLVAAVAALKVPADAEINAALWKAFDGIPWVSPQIAGALFRKDPRFLENARARLQSAPPPFGQKAWNALVGLIRRSPECEAWIQPLIEGRLREFLATDVDHGDSLATRWCEKINLHFP